MTTIHAAAASHHLKRLAFAALASLFAAGLGACSGDSNILGNSGDNSQLLSQQTAVQAAPAPSQIAIAPVIGAPEAAGNQLTSQLSQALGQKSISIAQSPADRADFTLRGYIVAAKEKTGTKISYIWDVTDATGKRVHRITGEELAGQTDSRDPWTAVTPDVMQSITNKTATAIGTWMQSNAAVANAGPASQPVRTAAAPPNSGAAAAATAPPAATASIASSGPVSATVPRITGAPGDGSISLTRALQRELSRNGIALSDAPTGNTYRVEGRVNLGPGQNGKQPIQIDWHVKDPQGKQLGTVSQKNEIPEGSLNGAWGKVADAAASAAAQGILKLLPAKATN